MPIYDLLPEAPAINGTDKIALSQSGVTRETSVDDLIGHITVGSIGFTPVNKAGDTAVGPLSLASTLAVAGTSVMTGGLTVDATGIAATFTGTGAIRLPPGTTAQRPDSGSAGNVRWNSETTRPEFGVGSAWKNFVFLDGDTMTGGLTATALTATGDVIASSGAARGIKLSGQVLSLTGTGTANLDFKVGGTAGLLRVLNENSASILLISGTSTPVNRLSLTASNAGGNIGIAANGTDTDISMNLAAKGAGFLNAQSRIVVPRIYVNPGTTAWTGSGAPSPSTSGFYSIQTHTGTGTTGGGPRLNYLSVGSESIDANPQSVQAFRLTHQIGAGATGQRQSFFVQGVQIGATPTTFGPLVAIASGAEMRFNSGGVAGARSGGVFGTNPYTIINVGATYCFSAIGSEFNLSVRDPTGVQRKTILQLVSDSADLYPGVSQDTCLTISSQNDAIGAKDAIGIGYWGAQFPTASSGETSVLRAYRQMLTSGTAGQNVKRGVDLLEADVTGWAFRTLGFQVHGSGFSSGAVQVGQGILQASSNNLVIGVPGRVGTGTPTVSAGGSGYQVGDILYDGYGGVYTVATVSGTAVATVNTPVRQPLIPGAAPSNPVPIVQSSCGVGDPGSGCTLTLSWTVGADIQIVPVGNVQIGTGSALSTGATAGFALLPTMAGTPSGTVGASGKAAFVLDENTGRLMYSLGSGTWKPTGYRRLNAPVSSVGNGADTTEDTLQSYTIPASALANVGDRIKFSLNGSYIASTDTKTVRLKVGGTTIVSTTTASAAVGKWSIEGVIEKTGSNTQNVGGFGISSTGSGVSVATTSLTDTSTIAVLVTGQNSTNSTANSITCSYFSVEYMPA